MGDIAIVVPGSPADRIWRAVYRIGFPLARWWWRLRRPAHQGALVAIYVGPALLLLRASYRPEWVLPGGGVRPGEAPEEAARRELAEELGIGADDLVQSGDVFGLWDGRLDRVHFFEWHIGALPALRLDGREIIAARLVPPDELPGLSVTGPIAAYLDRRAAAGHRLKA